MNKQLAYSDAVLLITESDTCKDINHSCKKLCQALDNLVENFDSMATQMNTLDLQRNSIHKLKPRWGTLCQVHTSSSRFLAMLIIFGLNAEIHKTGERISNECRFHLRTPEEFVVFHTTSLLPLILVKSSHQFFAM